MLHRDKVRESKPYAHEEGIGDALAKPARDEVSADELEYLRASRAALDAIANMARAAFKRGSIHNAHDVPSIALSAKIVEAADAVKRPDPRQA